MKKLPLAVFAVFAIGFATPAQAVHPFDETYGYVMPKKFKRHSAPESTSFFEPSTPKSEAALGDLFSDGKTKKKKKVAKGPKSQDGGGKPSISAVAPPIVSFPNSYGAGSIVIDTAGRKLYYVTSSSSAYRYPIAVGKKGFTWTGTKTISNEVSWPDWRPPAEMIARKPYLPEYMSGGVRNPLGAKALYLGSSLYRIHGTNDAKSIGQAVSSGCIRMNNGHVVHLASMAGVGTKVHVLNKLPSKIARAGADG
ncbi:MAG: L,D-transpeptidase [Hyphomicrobium sp.]